MSELCECTCGKPRCQSRMPSKSGSAHGTAPRYEQGCHCPACTEAKYRHDRAKDMRRQAGTVGSATKFGQPWTSAEMEVAVRDDITIEQIALMLGRTWRSVRTMRHRCRHDPKYVEMLGVSQ